ncbi:MAG: PAS domain S-box protein [Desulforhopalus sp.]
MQHYNHIGQPSDVDSPGLDFFKVTLYEHEDWLRVRHYDLAAGCRLSLEPRYRLSHRMSISGLNDSLLRTVSTLWNNQDARFCTPVDRDLPIVRYVVRDASCYRDSGFALTDYMTGLKCFRKAYLGLALEVFVDNARDTVLDILSECFDRCEIALCEMWDKKPRNGVPATVQSDHFFLPESDRFKILFESLPEPTILVDKQFAVSGLNIAAAEALGIASSKITRSAVLPGTHAENAQSREDLLGQPLKKVIPWMRETICTFKQTSGDLFTTTIAVSEESVTMLLEITVSRLLALIDKCEGAIVRVRDVSDTFKARNSLKQSSEPLYLALECATDSVWEYDLRSNQVQFSGNFYTMLGYEPYEFEPSLDRWKELLHPDDAPIVKEELRHTSQTGHPVNIEARAKTKSGEWKYIHGRGKVVQWDEERVPIRLYGTAVDISSRRKAERTLGRNERIFKGVFNDASVGIALVSPDGIITAINGKCTDLTGYSRDELVGKRVDNFYHPEELDQVLTNKHALICGKADTFRSERRIAKKDGSFIYVDQSTSVIRKENGTVDSLIAILIDTTERMRTEKELVINERVLRRYQELMKVILNGVPALIGYIDTDLRYKFVNSFYQQLHGLPPELVIGKRIPQLIGEERFEKVKHHYQKALNGETVRYDQAYDSVMLGKRHLEINYIPHTFEGTLEGIIILNIDATALKMAEQERDRFFDVSLDMFSVVDFAGCIKQVNPAWTKTLGWSEDELRSSKIVNLIHPRDRRISQDRFLKLTEGENLHSFENRVRCKDGTYRWVTWNSLPLPQEKLIYSVAHDTTHRREIEEQLRTMASIDPLTKIINRRHFFELGNVEFAKAKRHTHLLSVFMLDIDHFKAINDTYGHIAGDQVLRELAIVCQEILRETDLFGRFGGEEFAGVLIEVDRQGAMSTVQRILHGLAAHQVNTEAGNIRFTASIGTATLQDSDESLQQLLNRADAALYEAKRNGRNCVVHA